MQQELSAGAIIFRNTEEGRKYLLLKNQKGHWDFAKGHVESGEVSTDAAVREILEETGIKREDFEFVPGFKDKLAYSFSSHAMQGEKVMKTVVYFLASTVCESIQISDEHFGYGWFVYREALDHIKFRNARALLVSAEKFLKQKDLPV